MYLIYSNNVLFFIYCRYRQIYDPVLRPNVGECPVMGLNLGMRASGTVKLGDAVYIGLE